MAVIISQIRTGIDADHEEIISAALKRVGLSLNSVCKASVYKTSVDARDNSRISIVSSVWIEFGDSLVEHKI